MDVRRMKEKRRKWGKLKNEDRSIEWKGNLKSIYNRPKELQSRRTRVSGMGNDKSPIVVRHVRTRYPSSHHYEHCRGNTTRGSGTAPPNPKMRVLRCPTLGRLFRSWEQWTDIYRFSPFWNRIPVKLGWERSWDLKLCSRKYKGGNHLMVSFDSFKISSKV